MHQQLFPYFLSSPMNLIFVLLILKSLRQLLASCDEGNLSITFVFNTTLRFVINRRKGTDRRTDGQTDRRSGCTVERWNAYMTVEAS